MDCIFVRICALAVMTASVLDLVTSIFLCIMHAIKFGFGATAAKQSQLEVCTSTSLQRFLWLYVGGVGGSIIFYFTYPGVSSLLEFLCNGLVRGHDNKHLDGHVEDAHGDQVGHVVSVERKVHKWLSVNYSQ